MVIHKKGGIWGLMTMILLVSILSVMGITFYLINFGIMNDYVFYHTQNVSDTFADEGIISNNTANQTRSIVESYQDVIYYGDNIWFMIYILFIVISIMGAYELRDYTDVSFFMILFNGLILFLFIGGVIEIFTSWFVEEVTTKLMPNALIYFPKFEWYLNNLGVISAVHAVILLLISKFNFNFAIKKNINEQEVKAVTETNEVF